MLIIRTGVSGQFVGTCSIQQYFPVSYEFFTIDFKFFFLSAAALFKEALLTGKRYPRNYSFASVSVSLAFLYLISVGRDVSWPVLTFCF